MTGWRERAGSLRFRLLAATLAALALALLLAGFWLAGLFREHVNSQFEAELRRQLDQITAQLEFDTAGQPVIDATSLSDPRWQQPYSGLYWQLDRVSADGRLRSGVLRSRSLWDSSLPLLPDPLAPGAVHRHGATGPQGAPMQMLERTVSSAEQPGAQWRITVAGETQALGEAQEHFTGVLGASLLVLFGLLALAALAQVAVGLAPLRSLQTALQALREGRSQRLEGRFPIEVQPLIDDFNQVLERNTEVVERARSHAGNLAHALKTPLTVMAQGAAAAPAGESELARLVGDQVVLARRHIDWHLAHARLSAAQRLPGQATPLAPLLGGLLRVMDRVHAQRGLDMELDLGQLPEGAAFAGEEHDLQELLGNLLDNACQWARGQVRVCAWREAGRLLVTVEDDGPGIAPEQREAVLARGVRLDEATPGSGLGLAIASDLVALYGADLALQTSPLGGLQVRLSLPATAAL